jgi:hypothetical protein
MQFPHFQTPGAFLKRYFQNNPEQLKNYVGLGLRAVSLATSPLSVVLKHLIQIQGMDPNTEPGRRVREQFQQALNNTFQKFHDHEYDTDFDFSWLSKKFEEARNSNGQFPFDLSKDEFKELTDVSSLKSPPAVPPFAVPATRTTTEAGVPVTIDQSPVEELASLLGVPVVNQIAPEPAEQARDVFNEDSWLKAHGDIHANPPRLELPNDREELKDALKKLIDIAKEFEEDQEADPSQLMARTAELKKLRELLKGVSEPTRPLKKSGKIRRTPTGKVNAVKETPRKSPKATKKTLNRSVGLDENLTRPEIEAESIQDLISRGHLDPKDFDALVMEGLDLRSVNAWKNKYGDKHFLEGSTLKQKLRARLAAARDLADEMVARGLCDKNGVSEQVTEILKFPEDAFQSLRNVVMRHPVLHPKSDSKDLFRLEVLEKKQEISEQKFKSGKGPFRRSAQKRK